MKKVVELDPSNQQAKRSLFRLEPLAAEKREKLKEEMIGNMLPYFSQVFEIGLLVLMISLWKAVDIFYLARLVSFQEFMRTKSVSAFQKSLMKSLGCSICMETCQIFFIARTICTQTNDCLVPSFHFQDLFILY
jgi:hypothetical protein